MISTSPIIVSGGGFAGVWAAIAAARELSLRGHPDGMITLVSQEPFLTVRPRLYETPDPSMRISLAAVLEPVGVRTLVSRVVDVLPHERRVVVEDAAGAREVWQYEKLVLATGSSLSASAIEGASNAHCIDTYDAASGLEAHLGRMQGAHAAENAIVVVGASFTGIELVTELRSRLAALWGRERAALARLVLVERADSVGPEFGAAPRPHIEQALASLGIELKLGTGVDRIGPSEVLLSNGERIATRTTVLTTGLRASALSRALVGATLDEAGRLFVDQTLQVQGVEDVFAAGDIARATLEQGHTTLMSCQHAIPMGMFAGTNAARDVTRCARVPYQPRPYVTCLDLGPAGALFTKGWERRVDLTGSRAKEMKQYINRQLISPPIRNRSAAFQAVEVGEGC